MTIDRHEWYAPPQIYTRDDSTGLWNACPALLSENHPLSSCTTYDSKEMLCQTASVAEVDSLDPMYQSTKKTWMSECNRIHTSEKTVFEELQPQEDFRTKRQRVEEDLTAEGIDLSDGVILDKPKEFIVGDSASLLNASLLDGRGSVSANASVAEQVIEPTLVMFEVEYYSCFLY